MCGLGRTISLQRREACGAAQSSAKIQLGQLGAKGVDALFVQRRRRGLSRRIGRRPSGLAELLPTLDKTIRRGADFAEHGDVAARVERELVETGLSITGDDRGLGVVDFADYSA